MELTGVELQGIGRALLMFVWPGILWQSALSCCNDGRSDCMLGNVPGLPCVAWLRILDKLLGTVQWAVVYIV